MIVFFGVIRGFFAAIVRNWQLTLGVMGILLLVFLTNKFEGAIRENVIGECNAAQLQTELDAANASLITERTLNAEIQKELSLAQVDAVQQAVFIQSLQNSVRTGQPPEADGAISARTQTFIALLNQHAREIREELTDE